MSQWFVIGISGVTCGGKTTLSQMLREYFINQRNVKLWTTQYTISEVQIISQDDYFLPVDDLRQKWVKSLNTINFELITSLDMKQMISDITWTMKGRYLANGISDNVDFSNDIPSYSGTFDHFPVAQNRITGNHHSTQPSNVHNLSKIQYNNYQSQLHHNIKSTSHQNTSYIMHVNNSHRGAQLRDNKINILIIEGFMIFNQPELITLCNVKFHFHLPYEKCFSRRRKRTYDPPDVTGYFEMCVWPHYEKNFMEFRERKDITFLNGEICQDKIFKFVLQCIDQYFDERWDVDCPPSHKLLGISS